jgi:hypothetical protein
VGDLPIVAFVAERVTYRIYTETEEEASYLSGVLNSTVVNEAIKPFQTVGVYHGKRDITRRPFEVCPIPTYDSENSAHKQIAELAKSAKEKMGKWASKMDGTLAKVREQSRAILRNEISQIDGLLLSIFDSVPATTVQSTAAKHQHALFSKGH